VVYLEHFRGADMEYAREGDAGFDVRAAIKDKITLGPGERIIVACGFKIAVPFGFELQIRSRSGLSFKKGLIVLNAPGTIDAGYRGEVMALMLNTGSEAAVIEPGERIAQGVIAPVFQANFRSVQEYELPPSERGTGGFGSTGAQ
jgi:dUTP pyrophosphatase